ncbi:hypothetical protein WJX74_007192 [Apatococcus lobatus]|uniref:PDZ domain-containing protein n=1 Tax=Apatococcus lobatus TaxID=904363 RepID=A0AAW1QL30_9CHLO
MIRSFWRASRSAAASAFSAGAFALEYASGRAGKASAGSSLSASRTSVSTSEQPRGFGVLSPPGTALVALAGIGVGGIGGYQFGACDKSDAFTPSHLGRLASQGFNAAAEGVKGLNLWRLAHLEHIPAAEAASVPTSWVTGPFLGPHFIADAAAKAGPAVVNIMVQVGNDFAARRSGGSGCIISSEGTILTNAHVVAGVVAEQQRHPGRPSPILVSLPDGRTFYAEVRSFDKVSDLAVLEIKATEPLPVVSLGSSQRLRVGEWIVALGSPLHLSNSVTAGIVSCVDRKAAELGLLGASSDYIQTDAAINSGNSGGPLVNLAGEVVGISSMKAVAADGVSFAIPIDTARDVVQQLREHGRVLRPYAGIRMLQLTESMLPGLQAQDPAFPSVGRGILVSEVAAGSPAEKAGLRSGDVITGFGTTQDITTANLIRVLTKHINKQLTLEVKRRQGASARLQIIASEASPLL